MIEVVVVVVSVVVVVVIVIMYEGVVGNGCYRIGTAI